MTPKVRALSIIRPSDPEQAAPQPPMTLPDGSWIELDHPRRIPPLRRHELRLWQRGFLAAIRVLAGEPSPERAQ